MIHLLFPVLLNDFDKPFFDESITSKSLDWYKKLSIFQKINLKEIATIITGGIDFQILIKLFGFKDAINLLYEKLKTENIIKDDNY